MPPRMPWCQLCAGPQKVKQSPSAEHWSSLSDVICSQEAEGGHKCAWPTTLLTIEGEILVQCRLGCAKDIQQAALFRAAPQ